MSASAWSVALVGMQGTPIEVEAAIGGGLPRTVLVGLPDTALYEARDRCRAAVASAGLSWPAQLVTINLTPASLPKAGSHYDLAIVAAVLAAAELVPAQPTARTVLLGELGLDGRVRGVHGVLPALLAARNFGLERAIVPAGQVKEAALVSGISITGVRSLDELVEALHGRPVLSPAPADEPEPQEQPSPPPDLADVIGQGEARWALEVAAAGGHHLFLHGPPGVGKTMLAERLSGLLPDLDDADSLEVSAIHSLCGRELSGGLIRRPPYSDPHHSASVAALVGGGARVPRPGAISLAHRGVLFLDEAPEFSPRVLEALRTPMESGWITLARSQVTASYPARFQLVLAANPCPCGMVDNRSTTCRCPPMAIRRYNQRLSGPVLDRIDIHQYLRPVREAVLRAGLPPVDATATVAARVASARERCRRRLAGLGFTSNAELPGRLMRTALPRPEGLELVEEAMRRGQLSGRGVDKVTRLAWTLADLAGRDRPGRGELASAIALNKNRWSEGGR